MNAATLKQVADVWPHGMIVLDRDGCVRQWNQWMSRASGVQEEAALGRDLEQIFGEDGVARRLRAAVRCALETGTSAVLTRMFTPHPLPLEVNGTLMHQSVRVRSVRGEDGQRLCLVDVHDETTTACREARLEEQRRKLEEQSQALSVANVQLEAMNEELDKFVYHAGHDLKAPLRNLSTFCNYLRDDLGEGATPDVLEDLGHIEDCALRMTSLVSDLLDLAQSSMDELTTVDISARVALDQALTDLAPLLEETGAELTFDDLPTLRVNERHLYQVFKNLVENAARYGRTPGAPARIHVTYKDGVLGVRDEGPGLDAIDRERVLAPFVRADVESTGTGLGLSICKQITERYGGRFWCETAPGAGCHFRFTFGG